MRNSLLVCFALVTPLAYAEPPEPAREDVRIEELKRAYLRCSEAALGGRLGSGTIQHCSVVYEELKERAFGGDFLRLLAWSSAQAAARRTGN